MASRRTVESWIEQGRITINGTTAVLGCKVTPDVQIKLDGKYLKLGDHNFSSKHRVLLYNKPIGEICTRKDEQNRTTIFQNLPKLKNQRWISVGRLDINSSGLLLLTTDGQLAHKLMHPSSNIEREYAVRVLGEVSPEMIKKLTRGVHLDDGFAKFHSIKSSGGSGANKWYHVIIKEGRTREVRRLWESQGIVVSRLIRVRFGSTVLPKHLGVGKFIELPIDSLAPA